MLSEVGDNDDVCRIGAVRNYFPIMAKPLFGPLYCFSSKMLPANFVKYAAICRALFRDENEF